MKRADIISTIGIEYLVSNIENDEFSYPKAFPDFIIASPKSEI